MIESVWSEHKYQVLVLEISSFQLHWLSDPIFESGAILNIADDHTDWHGSFEAYTNAKLKLLTHTKVAIINGQDQHLVDSVNSIPNWSGRKIYFGLDTPSFGNLGLVEELLVDRAFGDDPTQAGAICELNDIQPTVPHAVEIGRAHV